MFIKIISGNTKNVFSYCARAVVCVCVRARVYVCCLTSAIEIVLFFFLVRLIIVSLQKNEGYIYAHVY